VIGATSFDLRYDQGFYGWIGDVRITARALTPRQFLQLGLLRPVRRRPAARRRHVDQTPKMVNDEVWQFGCYGLTRDNLGTFFEDGVPDTGHGMPVAESVRRIGRLVEALGRVPRMSDARAPETWPLLQDHAEQDWRDVVARVAVPSLFIAGRDSQLWPSGHATAAAATNSRSAALIVDDSGHPVNIDQPDLVNEALLKFLAGLA
jgi:non-heme chloroperoxidase